MKAILPILALLAACNTQEKTDAMVQARVDAERAKDLSTQVQELKTTNEELEKENEALKLELAAVKAKAPAAVGRTVASAKPARPAATLTTNASPAEKEQLKQQVSGIL